MKFGFREIAWLLDHGSKESIRFGISLRILLHRKSRRGEEKSLDPSQQHAIVAL
jgi:hypothetical protein